jgi:hypothetical protein
MVYLSSSRYWQQEWRSMAVPGNTYLGRLLYLFVFPSFNYLGFRISPRVLHGWDSISRTFMAQPQPGRNSRNQNWTDSDITTYWRFSTKCSSGWQASFLSLLYLFSVSQNALGPGHIWVLISLSVWSTVVHLNRACADLFVLVELAYHRYGLRDLRCHLLVRTEQQQQIN